MKNILVTGADGFIGKKLVLKLKKIGYNIFEHSVSDGDITTADFKFDEIDHVFHLAALTFVPASWENPAEFYRVNVLGTENVLEFCRKKNAGLTFPSTYVYGIPQTLPISEQHPIKPNTPYNHSKVLCESLCEFYNRAFGINAVILRPFNIYGAGQSPKFLIPTIINQVLDKDVAEIKVMDLLPKRDYLYVDDLIEAMCLSIGKEGYSIYNVGSGYSISVEDVIISVQNIAGIKKPYSSSGTRRMGEVDDVVADISKIKAELNWNPSYDWKTGISMMIEDVLKSINLIEK
jgi:nucleoside-diphosphate-sugar epimerase